ncbi:MAG: DUF2339 domain-containing protein [Chitinophagaceae bacterium]
MTGIIILLTIVSLIFFILLISINNKTSAQHEIIEALNKKMNYLSDQLNDLTKIIKERDFKSSEKIIAAEEKQVPPVKEEIYKPAPIPEYKESVRTIEPSGLKSDSAEEKVAIMEPVIEEEGADVITPDAIQQNNKTSWWNNSDLEKFIGENLANKIGIAVLVLGIAFFVKYAIDKDWIGETGRVAIGILCGGILISFAHYFRRSYRSFSSVLAGGGLAVFYFTIAFAFHQYHLITQQAAFISMVVITAFAVVLSLLYDRLEIAVLSVVGGFITPFLLSTGQDNYIALFTYLCILNTGMMVLAWFKKWPVINSISLIFTVIIYGSWLTQKILNSSDQSFPHQNAFLFATLFYIIFMIMNIVNNLRLKRSFAAFDFIIVLSTNFLYYAAGMIILQYWSNSDFKGLFTATLGIINLSLAWIFFRNSKADKNFIYLLIGLTLTFISLAAPVQLKGNYITLFWSAEAVVLFWLFQQSRIKLIKLASALVTLLTIISLLMDWSQIYFSNTNSSLPIIANKGFITTIVVALSLFIHYSLMKKEADSYYTSNLTNKVVRNLLLIAGLSVFYISGMLEIWFQFGKRIPGTEIYLVYLQLYSFCFALVLLYVFRKKESSMLLRFLLTLFCFAFYVISLGENYEVIRTILETNLNRIHLYMHWVAVLLLLKLLFDLVNYFRKHTDRWKTYQVAFTWISSTGIILLLSVEIHHFIIWINFSNQNDWVYWQNLYYKAGLSILWGVCSFAMMWLGMKYKFATLRIISLSLFSITLIKLFGYDIRNIPPGGKIAAFILLGVLLLTISFMYQRLKKMLIDDNKESK